MLSKDVMSEKTFIMPSAYDAKGGGEHFDMSYNILGMVRDFERDITHIRTLKWKFNHLGQAGHDMYFKWNINNGRYEPLQGHFDENSTEIPDVIWDNKSWLEKEYSEPLNESKPLPTKTASDAFDIEIDPLPF